MLYVISIYLNQFPIADDTVMVVRSQPLKTITGPNQRDRGSQPSPLSTMQRSHLDTFTNYHILYLNNRYTKYYMVSKSIH